MALCVASLFKRSLGQLVSIISSDHLRCSQHFPAESLIDGSQIILQSIKTKFISAVSKDFKRM